MLRPFQLSNNFARFISLTEVLFTRQLLITMTLISIMPLITLKSVRRYKKAVLERLITWTGWLGTIKRPCQ